MISSNHPQFIIFGHGRSGTKLLQIILAYILGDQSGDLDLYYEPLLWDHYKFSSVSRAGISVHKSLPMCPDSSYELTPDQHKFFDAMRGGTAEATLIKFIRMTGRSHLLHEIFCDARIVFLFRDPVSVMNSLKNWTVTLLGPPNYPSDIVRLVKACRDHDVLDEAHLQAVQRHEFGGELIYWYVTHCRALDDLERRPTPVISYDRLIREKEPTLRWICHQFGKEYKTEYLRLFEIPGYHIRHIDQLLKSIDGAHKRSRSLWHRVTDRVRSNRPTPHRFRGVYSLDSAPIFAVHTPPHSRKERLSEAEVAFVDSFCEPVLARLHRLEERTCCSRPTKWSD